MNCKKYYFIVALSLWLMNLSSCLLFDIDKKKKIDDYFYFDTPDDLHYGNIYTPTQGIFNGVCTKAKWNEGFIYVKVLRYKAGVLNKDSAQHFLINKKLYIENPIQEESRGILNINSLNKLDSVLNLTFTDSVIFSVKI